MHGDCPGEAGYSPDDKKKELERLLPRGQEIEVAVEYGPIEGRITGRVYLWGGRVCVNKKMADFSGYKWIGDVEKEEERERRRRIWS